MKFNVKIKAPVYVEIKEAFDYYENEQIELGHKLLNAIENALDDIKINPFGYQVKYSVYRTKLVKPFPYILIFEVINYEIIIYQFFCSRKNPIKKYKK